MNNKIKITTANNLSLFVDKCIQDKCKTINQLLLNNNENSINLDFPSEIIEIMLNYFENHKNEHSQLIIAPLINSEFKLSEYLNKKEIQTLEGLTLNKLQQLIVLTNYIQYTQLQNICCAYLANKLQYMDTNQIKQLFNIESDLNQKQIDRIKYENEWLEQ